MEAQKFREPENAREEKGAESQRVVVRFSQLQETLEKALNSLKPKYSSDEYYGKRFTITIENQAEKNRKGITEEFTFVYINDKSARIRGMEIAQLGKVETPGEKEVAIEIDPGNQAVRISWDGSPNPFRNAPTTLIEVREEGGVAVSRSESTGEVGPNSKWMLKSFKPPKKKE